MLKCWLREFYASVARAASDASAQRPTSTAMPAERSAARRGYRVHDGRGRAFDGPKSISVDDMQHICSRRAERHGARTPQPQTLEIFQKVVDSVPGTTRGAAWSGLLCCMLRRTARARSQARRRSAACGGGNRFHSTRAAHAPPWIMVLLHQSFAASAFC
jgi:hypothetical protein